MNTSTPHAALGTAEESRHARDHRLAAAGRRPVRHRHGRRAARAARSPARPARPRTTATRGSSATRRSSSSPSGSATRTSCIPMLTEFHGHPVAGGTFPALIWKAFMTKALAYLKAPPDDVPVAARRCTPAPSPSSTAAGCSSSTTASATTPSRWSSSAAKAPRAVATCKPNEVEVPDVVGQTLAAAKTRLDGPAAHAVDRLQARAGRRAARRRRRAVPTPRDALGLRQGHARASRSRSTASIPRVVGLTLARAQARARPAAPRRARRRAARAARSSPSRRRPRRAAAPGISLTLTVKRRGRNGRLRKRDPARP